MVIIAKKRFGQNFLRDKNILSKIIENAGITDTDYVIEIGPGLGGLTEFLIKKARKVTAVELDRDLIKGLENKFKYEDNLEIVQGDILKFKIPETPYKVVANIPYYITSPILNHFLKSEHKPLSMTLLMQKEVAEKIVERDNKKSIISLQVSLFAHAKIVQKIPPNAFYPIPKVSSALVHLKIKNKNDSEYFNNYAAEKILKIAKIAFTNKRKKLSNTLQKESLEAAGIDPNRRPETLTLSEWKNLSFGINIDP